MNRILSFIALLTVAIGVSADVTVGAARTDQYIDRLKGKRVALYSNHTGMLDSTTHTLDAMLANGVNVVTIFSPEHGFRGDADAGEHVKGSIDQRTGVPIVSLYGSKHKTPMDSAVATADVVAVDIQDVGLRYYTYYCTMLELMNSAAAQGKEVMVLDRPNPNGMTVDGPILDMKYQSGVGRLPIPVVHGMTLGELAQMINGEGWLTDGRKVKLTVIPCLGYTHSTRYTLPIAPSPNLRTMHAIYLYPSTCYFEATPVSLGRGTDTPFEIYGHPDMKGYDYTFTPKSVPGAKNPPQLGKTCYGRSLSYITDEEAIAMGVNLEYLIDAYHALGLGDKFFTPFFEKLIGDATIRGKIEAGETAQQIKASWADDVKRFRAQRAPYLIYPE